jgi:hypothetical protein
MMSITTLLALPTTTLRTDGVHAIDRRNTETWGTLRYYLTRNGSGRLLEYHDQLPRNLVDAWSKIGALRANAIHTRLEPKRRYEYGQQKCQRRTSSYQ